MIDAIKHSIDFISAPTIFEDFAAIFIILIVSSQNKPPGSGVPVAGIKLESKASTSKVIYTFLFFIIFLNTFKFHFNLSFAQKIFIRFLFCLRKDISFEEIFLMPNETRLTLGLSRHLRIADA